jgi:hypothetical protein
VPRAEKSRLCIDCGRWFRNRKAFRRCPLCASAINETWKQANLKVTQALRNGVLVRKACEICGNEKADAHHNDYSLPLEIMWLCRSHHRQFHAAVNRAVAMYGTELETPPCHPST